MSDALASNFVNIDTEYAIPASTFTEIVFGGSPGTTVYNGSVILFGRGSDIQGRFEPNASVENQWLIDGRAWRAFKLTGDAAFKNLYASGRLVCYFHVGYRVENGLSATGQLRYTSTGIYSESLIRLIEKLKPRYDSNNPVSINQAIASGGADLSGTFSCNPGDELLIQIAISQDTLGTSPHLSYGVVNDQNNATVLQAIGAAIPNVVAKSSVPGQKGDVAVTFNYKLHNGDSVSHWFVLNVYRVIA